MKGVTEMKYIDQIIIQEKDAVGMSAAEVYKCQIEDQVVYLKRIDVKYSQTTYSVKREAEVMLWLDGKLNVPKVVEYGKKENNEYLIMSEIKGKSIDDFAEEPMQYITYLADAIKLLHAVDVSNCPFSSQVDMRLEELDYLLKNNLADTDTDNWEDSTEFTDPQELYSWLCDNKPQEELVFSHGDISNLMIQDDEIFFFDLARCGLADKWLDISMCVREIRNHYHNPDYENLFYDMLGMEPDYEKIDYYLLLDEMF